MKKSLLSFLFIGMTFGLFAQTQLPNVGFENWTNVGNNDEEPLDYNSNKTGGGLASFGPQSCFRTTSPNSGTYCTELRTKNYLGTPVNGIATTGKVQAPNTNPQDGYIETLRSDADFNYPFTGRPDSLVGYYKYLVAGSDQGKVQVYLHGDYDVRNPKDNASIPYVYAEAKFLTPQASVSNWTRFSVPFVYTSSTTPVYALVVCTASSEAATAVDGSKMWIDDIQVVYAPTTGTETAQNAAVHSYWAGNDLMIDLSRADFSADCQVQLFDLNGKMELETVVSGTALHPIGTNLPAGVYVLRVTSGDRSYSVKMAKVD
ncbi:MAG: PCMD domain-containing protein [Bacteroidetes bacterium]|nr:PCMD domain-containing protein [Bacteroidota bacterium]